MLMFLRPSLARLRRGAMALADDVSVRLCPGLGTTLANMCYSLLDFTFHFHSLPLSDPYHGAHLCSIFPVTWLTSD